MGMVSLGLRLGEVQGFSKGSLSLGLGLVWTHLKERGMGCRRGCRECRGARGGLVAAVRMEGYLVLCGRCWRSWRGLPLGMQRRQRRGKERKRKRQRKRQQRGSEQQRRGEGKEQRQPVGAKH